MAEKELFWLGVGVICVGGKEYGARMPLPVSKIAKADLKKMKKDGRIGGMIEKIEAGCKDCAGHLETIQAKNALIGELKEAGNTEELDNEIERLTGENSELSTDTEEKAALIEKQKEEIKALKTAAKEPKK